MLEGTDLRIYVKNHLNQPELKEIMLLKQRGRKDKENSTEKAEKLNLEV